MLNSINITAVGSEKSLTEFSKNEGALIYWEFPVLNVESREAVEPVLRHCRRKSEIILYFQECASESPATFTEVRAIVGKSAAIIVIASGVADSALNDELLNEASDVLYLAEGAKVISARVRAYVRRTKLILENTRYDIVEYGCFVCDLNQFKFYSSGRLVHLTMAEFRIMRLLLEAEGDTVSRKLLNTLAMRSHEQTNRALDVHVANIRSKLGSSGNHIVAIRGVGYSIVLEQTVSSAG